MTRFTDDLGKGLSGPPSRGPTNLRGQVVDRIGTSIVRGDVAPGDALPSEVRICETLGVSRTVVREAIRMLVGKGLVESRAKSGTRVRPPEEWNQFDPDVLTWQLDTADVKTYLDKLFALRNALEPVAASLAASAATAEDRAFLRDSYDAMAAARDPEDFVRADIAFHTRLYIATRNEFFWPIAQMFENALRRSFTIAETGDHRSRALAEHSAVMEAVTQGQPAQAHAATILLLNHSVDDLVRIRADGATD